MLARLVVALPVAALADLPAELLDAIEGHAALARTRMRLGGGELGDKVLPSRALVRAHARW